jgi:hypothetical protein
LGGGGRALAGAAAQRFGDLRRRAAARSGKAVGAVHVPAAPIAKRAKQFETSSAKISDRLVRCAKLTAMVTASPLLHHINLLFAVLQRLLTL